MRFRRSRSASRSKGKRRRVAWGHASAHGTITGNITPGSSLLGVHWAKFPAGVLEPGTDNLVAEDLTLVKSFHWLEMQVIAGSSGHVDATLWAGMIVWESVSGDDADIDPLLVPLVTFDGDADWIWTWYGPFTQQLAGSAVIQGANDNGPSEPMISRAQRKLSARQGLLLVFGCDNEDTSDENLSGLSLEYQSRALFKLP